jgi:hypothetical protein
MGFEEYKKDLIEHRRKSVQLFSPTGKIERELWVTREFLDVLGVAYAASELKQPKDDPPDVIFRDANFEIIELYDDDRKRHDEYKDKLKKAEAARDYSEIGEVVSWDMEPVSLPELLLEVEGYLQRKKGRYSLATKARLDVLVYINLQKKIVEDEDHELPTPLPQRSPLREWRSVALVFNGHIVCVPHASNSSPEIIRTKAGKVVGK